VTSCAVTGDVLADDFDPTGFGLPQSRQRVDQLRLAVAVDARDAHDLAAANLERHSGDLLDAAVIENAKPLDP
jgi:hypothetical protein